MGSMMKHVLLIRNLNEEIAPEAYSLPPCKAHRRARVLQRTSGAGQLEQGRGPGLNAISTPCTYMGRAPCHKPRAIWNEYLQCDQKPVSRLLD
jgi:hypothetical protein